MHNERERDRMWGSTEDQLVSISFFCICLGPSTNRIFDGARSRLIESSNKDVALRGITSSDITIPAVRQHEFEEKVSHH